MPEQRLNPRTLNPAEIPAEWDDIDKDLAMRLRQNEYGLRTKEQWQIIKQIRAARHLLLRNDHRARCGRCGAIHEYITLGCIERPFNGLDEVHLFELQQAKERGQVRGEHQIITTTTVESLHVGVPEPINRKTAKKLILRIRAKLGRNAI